LETTALIKEERIEVMKSSYTVFVEERAVPSLASFKLDFKPTSRGLMAARVDLTPDKRDALRASLATLQANKQSSGLVHGTSLPVKAVFFDMDSTAIEQETINELAALAGKEEEISRITEEAMKGLLSFPEALKARLGMLRGLAASSLGIVARKVTLSGGMSEFCAVARKKGIRLYLISGGFNEIAEKVASELRMDAYMAHQLEFQGGKLTGNLASPLIDSGAKAEFLKKTCAQLGITTDNVVAVGDGANDIAMLDVAGIALGFNPKATLIPHIHFANYRADHALFCDVLSLNQ
jgi:phosphoserine phosphatase